MTGIRFRSVTGVGLGGFLLFAALAAPLRAATCTTGGGVLCLNGGRFKVEVQFQDFAGHAGSGHPVALTGDTGYFWFFTDTNVELVVKVLDARAINGSFWVFYGALSNVPYTITVTDLASNAQKVYTNPSGTFASAGDTSAFPQAAGSAVADSAQGQIVPASAPRAQGAATPSCTADAAALCLSSGRFRVEVNFTDFSGHTGRGQAVPLTADTGYFWFFNEANVELVVKALDARSVNGNYWVFFGALSSVAYEVVVLDTATGESKRYRNPSGRFASTGDTAAFPLSPGTPLVALTEVGTPSGPIATASIGPAGGTLGSQDGNLILTIPPGAVPAAISFTIEPITNEAPGGVGGAYRLGPEGQAFAAPAQVSFRYANDLSGPFVDASGIAYQDAQHAWRVLTAASRDAAARRLTVSTSHLSDWAFVEGYSLKPSKPTVHVGNSLGLMLAFCDAIENDDLTTLVSTCVPSPGDVTASAWAVSGVAGGNATTGTVTASGDFTATFVAPASKPDPNVVSVGATLDRGSDRYPVSTDVTIVDDALADSWVGTAEGSFGPASVTVEVTWALDRTGGGITTYRPSGTAHYAFMDCTITPSDGPLSSDGFLTVDFTTSPPTYDGIGDGIWTALFSCPGLDPGENPVTFLYFDAAGSVSADGTTIEGTALSRDDVWNIHWHFTHVVPGSP
jgi:hypothetical protein